MDDLDFGLDAEADLGSIFADSIDSELSGGFELADLVI